MYETVIKRSIDTFVSLLGIMVLMPVLVLCAIAVFLQDGFPIFFRQRRVGRDGILFDILKFRTMSTTNKQTEEEFDVGNTSRITPVGLFLRSTKLDELPQLWNVLKGDMSLVGPRPEVQTWVKVYPERWQTVLNVKPGITDRASIRYRNEELELSSVQNPDDYYAKVILPRKLAYYEQYVGNVSFTQDISILVDTVVRVLKKS